jgi:hypothetical protein
MEKFEVLEGYLSFINKSVMDRQPNFHFDADPDRHQNDADSHADPTNTCCKIEKNLTFIYSNASLQCFSLLMSDKVVILLSISDSILKFSGKKSQLISILRKNDANRT